MSSNAPVRETRGAVAAQQQAQQEQIDRQKRETVERKKQEKAKRDRERRERIKAEKKKGERGNYWSAAGKRVQDRTQSGTGPGRGSNRVNYNDSSDLTEPPDEIEGEEDENDDEEEDQDQEGDGDGEAEGEDGNGDGDDGSHPNKRSRAGSSSMNNSYSFSSNNQIPAGGGEAAAAFYPNPIQNQQGGSNNYNNRQNPNQNQYRPPMNNQMGPPSRNSSVGYGQLPGGVGQNSYQQQMNRNYNQNGGYNAPGTYPQNSNASSSSSVFAPPNQIGNKMAPPANNAAKSNELGDRDIYGGSGVNLDFEQEALYSNRLVNQAAADNPSGVNRHGKDLIDHAHLAPIVARITSRNGLTNVDPAVFDYLSAAAYLRFRNLTESMISASRHRSWSSHQRPPPTFSSLNSEGEQEDSQIPMYHEEMISDPKKQLAALERIDRQMEEKAQLERQKRELQEQALLESNLNSIDGINSTSSAAGGGGGEDSKSKKKPISVKASAKNMSEDLSRKLTNSTVAHMAGGVGVKSWMTGSSTGLGGGAAGGWKPKSMAAAGGTSSLPAPKFAPQASKTAESLDSNDQASSSSSKLLPSSSQIGKLDSVDQSQVGAWGDVAARIKREEEEEKRNSKMVKMEDALFALEMEKSAGAGKGSGIRTLYKERAKPREKRTNLFNVNLGNGSGNGNVFLPGPSNNGTGLGLGYSK